MNDVACGSRWWGAAEIGETGGCSWRIGPLSLWIACRAREWQIAQARSDDLLDGALDLARPLQQGEPPPTPDTLRFVGTHLGSKVTLTPLLADRPVVCRPDVPLHLPAGGEIDLFLSTPAWVRVEAGDPPSGVLLIDVPTFRLSDTWFGPGTRDGELCYAMKAAARLDVADLPSRPHRVTSLVTVKNNAKDSLHLERIKLPAPNLTLYADRRGALWTQSLTVERDEGGTLASVRLGKTPPSMVEDAGVVSEPRAEISRHVLTSALHALLS